jgi:hypothetical protein
MPVAVICQRFFAHHYHWIVLFLAKLHWHAANQVPSVPIWGKKSHFIISYYRALIKKIQRIAFIGASSMPSLCEARRILISKLFIKIQVISLLSSSKISDYQMTWGLCVVFCTPRGRSSFANWLQNCLSKKSSSSLRSASNVCGVF